MRLVLCDDNRILGEALADAFRAWGHEVAAVTTTAADGIAAVSAHQPDVVLLDPHVPPGRLEAEAAGGPGTGTENPEGLIIAGLMRRACRDTAVLVLSGRTDRAAWSAAAKMGVAGFLGKNHDLGQIAEALQVIAAGGVVFDPTVSSPVSPRPSSRRRGAPLGLLTSREKEVLRRIVAGQGTEQMADEMNIAINTLRTYVKNVLSKLGAHSRLQAAALATRENLLGELSA